MDRLNNTKEDYKILFSDFDSRSLKNIRDQANIVISSNASIDTKENAIIDIAECHYISNFSFSANLNDIPTFTEYLTHWLYADQKLDYMIVNRLKSKLGSKPKKLNIDSGCSAWIET